MTRKLKQFNRIWPRLDAASKVKVSKIVALLTAFEEIPEALKPAALAWAEQFGKGKPNKPIEACLPKRNRL